MPRFCLTFCMEAQDGPAARHLEHAIKRLGDVGLARLLEEHVAAVWRRNLDEHDPLHGDNAKSLGIRCHENLRELLSRECNDATTAWASRGVSASTSDGSLAIRLDTLRVSLMKAPPSSDRTPAWESAKFNWLGGSDVRHDAAMRNSRAYDPPDSDQPGSQLAFAVPPGQRDAPSAMLDCLLVWSGDLRTGQTAGWVGLPKLAHPYWYAVEPLWWHDDRPRVQSVGPTDGPSSGPRFDEQPIPLPAIRLRRHLPKPGEAGT